MKPIAQRELRNNSGRILRRAERGERFTVTVGGRPVAELGPVSRRVFARRADYARALTVAPPDTRFFDDIAILARGGAVDDPWRRRQ